MADFFDDPDFAEQLARRGIQHRPGMGAELMQQLAPLLKAEGIDLDDPDRIPDAETFDAAMAVAVERHNMHLHTPVGLHRDLALAMLREIAVSIAAGDSDAAVDLFDSIAPEETEVRPAASHVTGVALGLLDEWFADQRIQRDVLRATVPKFFSKPSRNVARDLFSLAMKGRAVGSIEQLIRRNGGLVVAEAGVLGVTGVLIARAKSAGVSVRELGVQVLTAAALPPNRSGSSFSAATIDLEAAEREPLLRGLREWLDGQDFLPDEADELVEDLTSLFSFMRAQGSPIERPTDVEMIGWLVNDSSSDENAPPVENVLMAIDTLVHFHMATSDDPDAWDDVHDSLEEAGYADPNLGAVLAAAEKETAALPGADRLEAFNGTRLCAATRELLEWLGDRGQGVTGTGLPRRADIATVAGMLGIEAVGVAKSPRPDERGLVRHVKSAIEIPELLTWWDSVMVLGITDVTKTRVRLGDEGRRLRDGSPWSIELVDALISQCVAIGTFNLCARESEDDYQVDHLQLSIVSSALFAALRDESMLELGDVEIAVQWRVGRATRWLLALCSLGVLERQGERFTVPVEWRAPVARGLYQAVSRIQTI